MTLLLKYIHFLVQQNIENVTGLIALIKAFMVFVLKAGINMQYTRFMTHKIY